MTYGEKKRIANAGEARLKCLKPEELRKSCSNAAWECCRVSSFLDIHRRQQQTFGWETYLLQRRKECQASGNRALKRLLKSPRCRTFSG